MSRADDSAPGRVIRVSGSVVAENLGVDHIIVKPRFDLLRAIFVASTGSGMYPPRALERASAICNSCMGLAKGIGLRLARAH